MRFNRGEHIRQASIPAAWESNSNWCSLHFLNNDDLVSVDTSTLKPKATQLILFSDQSGPLIKKIDGTARDIGESIKDAQEGKSDKKPKSASKLCHLRINENNWRSSSRVSNVHDKTDQRGERVDELLHLVPGIVRHLGLGGQGLPRLVGDSIHGEDKMV